MAAYERVSVLQSICDNVGGTVDEESTDYEDVRILRAIVTAEGGTPTPVAGTYERISLMNDWITAIGASAPATTDYAAIERLRVIATDYSATTAPGSDYEEIRILRGIETATTP